MLDKAHSDALRAATDLRWNHGDTDHLVLQGVGAQTSGTDLARRLYTRNRQTLAHSEHETPVEAIVPRVDPGTYIIFVHEADIVPALLRCGTPGRRTIFVLRVRQGVGRRMGCIRAK